MYEGETYNQYGRMDYGKAPEMYGGAPLGGKEIHEPHYGPPLNPHNYGGPNQPGGEPMHRDYEVPDILTGGGGNQRIFANPFGHQNMGFGGNPHNVRHIDDDYANYLKNPPKGIYTIHPLSEEKTTENLTIPQHSHHDDPPRGMMANLSADSFERYHGSDGLQNLRPYRKNRRVIELNERRASYAFWLHAKRNSSDFDNWTPPVTLSTRTTTKRITTTEFVPRADVTLPDYIFNF